jgi:cysteine-rich repeat protein
VIAPLKQEPDSFKSGGVTRVSRLKAPAGVNVLENDPPGLCAGHGEFSSISLTDWEVGLGSWTVGTHDVAIDFNTPDWDVVSNLPDSRLGQAAFVADLESVCGGVDESGALTLDSPPIVIPGDAPVPRILINHWFATEFGYDGGNIKINVNGAGFNLIPASAIEFSPYNSTLISAIGGNTNPLAGQVAFTGPDGDQPAGSWEQSRINLMGIAAAGYTIELRFDFGVDFCDGLIGWFVDDVEVYSCSAELPPSDCGNVILDTGEQCDDGNTFIDDGCSNTCQIDDGWQCTAPTPPGVVPDASFEAGTPDNPFWTEASTNFGSPICDEAKCGTGTGSGPADGSFWAWFGGNDLNVFPPPIDVHEEASLSQSVVFPSMATELQFELEVSACDSASDYIEVLIDGNREFFIDGLSPLCGFIGYTTQSVDISAIADGASHIVEFHAETFAVNADVSNFFVDALSIPRSASICTRDTPNLTLVKAVINDSGRTEKPSAWVLTASGPTGFSGNGPSVPSGSGFDPGTYDLSESGPDGYTASDWVCVGVTQDDADTVTLGPDDSAVCTLTNNDTEIIFADGFESN